MINYSGAKAVPLNLSEEDNFEINLEKLEQLITNKTSLIIINNPNNPNNFIKSFAALGLFNKFNKITTTNIKGMVYKKKYFSML